MDPSKFTNFSTALGNLFKQGFFSKFSRVVLPDPHPKEPDNKENGQTKKSNYTASRQQSRRVHAKPPRVIERLPESPDAPSRSLETPPEFNFSLI
jgi:hypothetical protein